MNEEALKDSYDLFVAEGYEGSIEEFSSLLSSNPEALKDSYSLFQREGYEQPIEDYEMLVGVKKKGEPVLVSQLGDGSSALPSFPPNETFNIDGKEVTEQEFIDYENEMVTETVQYDPREDNDQGTEISYRRGADQFEKSLSYITPELIDREEEEVVDRMNYLFEEDGFEFTEGGGLSSGFDGMTVKSKNTGEEMVVNLDPVLGDLAGGQTEGAQELQDFIKQNKKEQSKMDALEKNYDIERKKYFSAKARQNDIESFSAQAEALNKRIKSFLQTEGQLKTAMDALMNQPREVQASPQWQASYAQLKTQQAQVQSEKNSLRKEGASFKQMQSDLNRATGEYLLMKQSDSSSNILETSLTSVKGMVNKFIGGVAEPVASAVGGAMDVFYGIGQSFVEDLGMTSEEYRDSYVDIADYLNVSIPVGAEKDERKFQKWLDSLAETPTNKDEFEKLGWDTDRIQVTAGGDTLVWKNNGGFLGNGGFEDAPEGFFDDNLKDRFQRLVKDQKVKSVKEPTKKFVRELTDFLKFDDVSEELISKQSEDSIIMEGLYGLSKSMPSMLPMLLLRGKSQFKGAKGLPAKIVQSFKNYATNKGRVATTSMMSLLQTDALMQEMENDPNFKYITETEKKKLTLPLALSTAILESYGLRNVIQNKTLLTGLLNNVIKILPKGATANQFTRAIKKIIESNIAKGLYSSRGFKISSRIARGALAEAETGGLQAAEEIRMKNVWNSFNEKALFSTPEMWSAEFGKQVIRGALAEAVGGFVMSIPGAVLSSAAENKLDELSQETFELFEKFGTDETTMLAYKNKLKTEVNSGVKTQEQADLEYQEFEILSNTANKMMGSDLSIEDRQSALNKIYQITQLEKQMDELPSKDLGTYQQKKAQVDFLKEQLSEIGRTEAQAQSELASEVQSFEQQDDTTTASETDTKISPEEVGIDEEVTEEDRGDIDEFFDETVESNEVVLDNLSINNAPEGETAPVRDSKMQVFVLRAAKKAASSIKALLPNVKMVIHQTQKQFEEATGGRKGAGFFRTNDNSIHINLNKAGRTTVAHEVFHALVVDKIGNKNSGQQIVNAMSSLVGSIRKTLPENSELIESMDKFVANYDSNSKEINEERAAELFGILAGKYETLSAPSKNKVVEFIKSIAKRFGINLGRDFTQTDQDVIDLLNTLAQKVRSGETIIEEDLNVLSNLSPDEELDTDQEQGEGGQVGTFTFPEDTKGKEQRTPLELGLLYKMNKKGFMPTNIPEGPLIKSAREYGLRVERDFIEEGPRRGDFAGYHFSKDGKFFNPRAGTETIQGREQKMADANDLFEAIVQGREEGGFSDSEIKDYLIRNTAFKARQINEAFKTLSSDAFDSSTFRKFPRSFGNMKGGFTVGLNLMSKIDDYYQKLVEKNNRLKDKVAKKTKSKYDELTDYGDLTPLTEEQIRENVIEWFTTLPEFTREGGKGKGRTSQQLTMEKDLLNLMLPDPFRANPERIASINKRIREIKFDEKNLKEIQRQLRAYIRSVLPRTIYTKAETGRLLKLVNEIDASNIESVKNEVMKVVTEKTNQSLQETILNILNRKNQTIQTGRLKGVRVDNETRKRLIKINNMVLDPKATADQINEKIEELLKKYNEAAKISQEIDGKQKISLKDDLNQAEIDLMAELTIAMQMNNAFTQEMNDPNKTTLLGSVLNSLNQMEATGKALFEYQLIEDAAIYRENSRKAFKEITGIDLDPLASLIEQGLDKKDITTAMLNREYKRLKDEVALDQERVTPEKKAKILGRVKDGVLKILKYLDNTFLGTAEDLTALIEQISTQPGEIFQGDIQLQADQIRAGTRMYKQRMIYQELQISQKMTDLYGNRWTKMNRKNSNQTESIVYSVEKQRVLEAELKDIESNKELTSAERTIALKKKHSEINSNIMPISQNQLLYYYSQMQDPSLAKSFENTFKPTDNYNNEFESRIRKEIENKLDPKLKEFSTWLVQEYYPSVYNHYNDTYKKIYRTDMPWNQFYAGRLYRQNTEDADSLDLLADSASWITNVASSSSKARQQNSNPIKQIDGIDALLNYTRDMEYFAALAVPIRDINKVFTDPLIVNTIENEFGKEVLNLINASIQKIANKGIRQQRESSIINVMNNTFLLARLGLNPTLILKQMTSFVTYANDIGYTNWILNAPSIPKGIAAYKEIMANSVVLKDRYNKPITESIETYAEKKFTEINGGPLDAIGITKERQNTYTRWLMSTTMTGDKAAIIFGGVPNYLYYKKQFKAENKNATEQEAIDYAIKRFESDTLRTQQSSDLQDKDYFQTSGALARAFNMFLTTPKQYFRREIIAVRNMSRIIASGGKKGKGSFGENLRTFGTYHVVMPVIFEWASQGFPGLARDADDEDLQDLGMAAIIGNINAIFILGDIFEVFSDYITGKPWADKAPTLPALSQATRISSLLDRATKTKDPKKRAEAMNKFYGELATISSLPVPTLQRFVDNWGDLLRGDSKDTGQFILKLFNFSKYAQGDRKKKKTTTKKPTTKSKSRFSNNILRNLQNQRKKQRLNRPF